MTLNEYRATLLHNDALEAYHNGNLIRAAKLKAEAERYDRLADEEAIDRQQELAELAVAHLS